MTKKIITLLSTALLFCNSLFAQSSGTDTFQLEKNTNGHYIFKTKINHQLMATIFLESGIHVMLIDSLYAFENSRHLNLDFVKTKRYERMNLGGRKYKITHKATGTIQLGDNTKYSGEIFVLSNYHSGHDMAIPIQRISHSNDGAHIIKLDMKNYRLQVLNRKLFSSEPTNYNTITINYDTYQNMPAVRTDLCFKHKGKSYTLSGNFVLDLGNASFLFLMKQNPAVQDFLKNNTELKIQTAYNKKGVPVGEAIVAEQANLCKKSFKQQIIAITPALPKFTTEGCIGLKFFDGSISVFDFDKHEFHFQ